MHDDRGRDVSDKRVWDEQMIQKQGHRAIVVPWVVALALGLSFVCRLAQGAGRSGQAEGPAGNGGLQARSPRQTAIWKDYERAERFGSRELNRLVYKAEVRAHWIADRPAFWYRNDVRGEREFILPRRGDEHPAAPLGQQGHSLRWQR